MLRHLASGRLEGAKPVPSRRPDARCKRTCSTGEHPRQPLTDVRCILDPVWTAHFASAESPLPLLARPSVHLAISDFSPHPPAYNLSPSRQVSPVLSLLPPPSSPPDTPLLRHPCGRLYLLPFANMRSIIILFVIALIVATVQAAALSDSNAQRMARGLPPRAPRKIYRNESPTGVAGT